MYTVGVTFHTTVIELRIFAAYKRERCEISCLLKIA